LITGCAIDARLVFFIPLPPLTVPMSRTGEHQYGN